MPISITCDETTSTITLTYTGLISVTERRESLAKLLPILDDHSHRYVLFDGSGGSDENDQLDILEMMES